MSWKIFSLLRPVADELPLFCCGSCREVGDPCINPSNRIRNICTINGNLIADEKILRDIRFYPLAIVLLLSIVHRRSPTCQTWEEDSFPVSPKDGIEKERRRKKIKKAILHIRKIDRRLSIRARIPKWQAMASTLSIDGHHDDAMHRNVRRPKSGLLRKTE